jgi:type I restriction enzyme S subunit
MILPIPPIELQTRFADFVRAADKSKFELQRTLDELEATYKALLREKLG